MYLGKNIKYLRQQAGLTQEALSEHLGVQRTMISAYEDGRSEPKLPSLTTMAEIFGLSVDRLLRDDLSLGNRVHGEADPVKILTVTVDKEDNETITLIGQKASAGYLNGFADPEYVGNQPQFHLPQLSRNHTYRAFEISGDSMLPIAPGTVIIGSYIEQANEIKNGKTYILVTRSEGIVYKRVFNYLADKGKLFLVSDNDRYKPFEVFGEDIMEVWEAKAFISLEFPEQPDQKKEITLEDIARMIQELKADISSAR